MEFTDGPDPQQVVVYMEGKMLQQALIMAFTDQPFHRKGSGYSVLQKNMVLRLQ